MSTNDQIHYSRRHHEQCQDRKVTDCEGCMLLAHIDAQHSEIVDLHQVAQGVKHYWMCGGRPELEDEGGNCEHAHTPCVRCERDRLRSDVESAQRYQELAEGVARGLAQELAVCKARLCSCHLGSICGEACEQGKHHDWCGPMPAVTAIGSKAARDPASEPWADAKTPDELVAGLRAAGRCAYPMDSAGAHDLRCAAVKPCWRGHDGWDAHLPVAQGDGSGE